MSCPESTSTCANYGGRGLQRWSRWPRPHVFDHELGVAGRGAGKCSVVNSTSISATEIPVPLLDFPRPASPTNMNCESSISSIAVTRRRRPVTPEWTRRIHTCRRPRTALRDGRPPGSTAALRGGPVIASRRRCVRRTIWVPLRDNHVTAGGRPACRELPAPRSRPAAFRR